ncbi:protein kinase domain-containing protein [Actinoplanes sp. G11-F43]|uniref:serine/threonine-protein kinase n=1 Tax=Actinoplanes sp. G11-F43 TaxID=3424130 RepID=UPI003D333769
MAVRQRLVADRYRLLEPVGAGGMGRVWLARDEMLHRDVAVKEVVPPEWMTDAEQHRLRGRTLREARSAARLNHPHVVRIYDVVYADGQSWIVMEYVPSRSLQQVLHEDGPYGPAEAARIGLAVLDALAAAHRAGVLHRDVKPHNVLIGTDGRVVLTDFGLATFVDDGTVTAPGLIVGSPQYVSPERARDGASTVESDLWSLGATLYAAVEGRSPYARETAMATLAALATEPPDPPVRAGPLAPVLSGLLRYRPASRLTAPEIERRLRMIVAADPREIPRLPTQRTSPRPRSAGHRPPMPVPETPETTRPRRPAFGTRNKPHPSPSPEPPPTPPAPTPDRAPTTPPVPPSTTPPAPPSTTPPVPSPGSAPMSPPVPHSGPVSEVTPAPAPATVVVPAPVSTSEPPHKSAVPETAHPERSPGQDLVLAGPQPKSAVTEKTPHDSEAAHASHPMHVSRPAHASDTTHASHAPGPPGRRARRFRMTRARLLLTGLVVLLLGGSLTAGYLAKLNQTGVQVFLPTAPESATMSTPGDRAVPEPPPGSPTSHPKGGEPPGTGSASSPSGKGSPNGTNPVSPKGPTAGSPKENIPGSHRPGEGQPSGPDAAVGQPAMPTESKPPTALSGSPPSGTTPSRAYPSETTSAGIAPSGIPSSGTASPGTASPGTASSGATSSGAAPPDSASPPSAKPRTAGPVPTSPPTSRPTSPATSRPELRPPASGQPSAGTGSRNPSASKPATPGQSPRYSPVLCDAAPPAGLPKTPQKGATRGVNGWTLQSGWSYFRDGSGFHLAVPDGWTYQRIGGTYCFRSPANARVLSLDPSRDPASDPLTASRAEERRVSRSGNPEGYDLVRIAAVPLLNKAADWEFRYRSRTGALRHSGIRWFVIDGRAYTLGWSTPAENWKADLVKIQMIRGTFYANRNSPPR